MSLWNRIKYFFFRKPYYVLVRNQQFVVVERATKREDTIYDDIVEAKEYCSMLNTLSFYNLDPTRLSVDRNEDKELPGCNYVDKDFL